MCIMCDKNVVEDEFHFILQCKIIMIHVRSLSRNIIGLDRQLIN